MSAAPDVLPLSDHFIVSPVVSPVVSSLFDPVALAIVLAGTLVATLARSGTGDARLALGALAALTRAGFNEDANRAAIAVWARAIRQRGVLGAEAAMPPDPALAAAITALVRGGSIGALRESLEAMSANTLRERGRAIRVFEQAGDLAPVFGLVGTLFSMTQLAPATPADAGAVASALTLGAIATAVLSTLYGVVGAHLVFLPLAHAVARRSQREDEARAALVEWLAREIGEAVSDKTPPYGIAPIAPSTRVAPLRKVA